jgi:hypothetical protein
MTTIHKVVVSDPDRKELALAHPWSGRCLAPSSKTLRSYKGSFVGLGPYLYTAISRVLSDKMRVLAKLQRVGVPARRTVCAYVLASSTLLPISLLLLARSILQLAQHLQLTYAKNRLIATGTYRAFAFFVFLTLAHSRLQGSYKGLYSSRLANLVELGILNLLQLVFRIPLVYDTEATHDAVWRSTCLILTKAPACHRLGELLEGVFCMRWFYSGLGASPWSSEGGQPLQYHGRNALLSVRASPSQRARWRRWQSYSGAMLHAW